MKKSAIGSILLKRTAPGVIILNAGNEILYSNDKAHAVFPTTGDIPEEVFAYCAEQRSFFCADGGAGKDPSRYLTIRGADGNHYSVRALPLRAETSKETFLHVMLLIERYVKKHRIDFDRTKEVYQLTDREQQIVMLVCAGLSNVQIARRLEISAYTVKDHIKNIMRKMEARSRSDIINICEK